MGVNLVEVIMMQSFKDLCYYKVTVMGVNLVEVIMMQSFKDLCYYSLPEHYECSQHHTSFHVHVYFTWYMAIKIYWLKYELNIFCNDPLHAGKYVTHLP